MITSHHSQTAKGGQAESSVETDLVGTVQSDQRGVRREAVQPRNLQSHESGRDPH